MLAYTTFPEDHLTKIYSSNSIVRLNGEIKRGAIVVGIFPSEAEIFRPAGAILLEQNDEWAVQRARYMALKTIMVDTCVSLECFSFPKSRSQLWPGVGGSPEPSVRHTLFIEAQAFQIAPSAEKWSALSSFSTRSCASNVLRNSGTMSVVRR